MALASRLSLSSSTRPPQTTEEPTMPDRPTDVTEPTKAPIDSIPSAAKTTSEPSVQRHQWHWEPRSEVLPVAPKSDPLPMVPVEPRSQARPATETDIMEEEEERIDAELAALIEEEKIELEGGHTEEASEDSVEVPGSDLDFNTVDTCEKENEHSNIMDASVSPEKSS